MTTRDIAAFRTNVLEWYHNHGRNDLPWRQGFLPYHVFLSELMLQQTQVPRVLEKFALFTAEFPTIEALAEAPQSLVLSHWKGLGYNRRALFLHRSAKLISEEFSGEVPENEDDLISLPGVGIATARAIQAYAFNKPVVYIETNIRACLIHHFFPDEVDVEDGQLEPIAQECLQGVEPRHWYSALMDYGTWLKRAVGNPNRRSKHYTVQSRFEGSDRQLRGRILEALLKSPLSIEQLNTEIPNETHRMERVLHGLEKEGFIAEERATYLLK